MSAERCKCSPAQHNSIQNKKYQMKPEETFVLAGVCCLIKVIFDQIAEKLKMSWKKYSLSTLINNRKEPGLSVIVFIQYFSFLLLIYR